MSSYRTKHFTLSELVAPNIFEDLGEKAWDLLDPNLLAALDKLRERFGPITVNNWRTGGPYKESGLREQDTKTGAPKSAHKRGKAADCKPVHGTVKEMFDYILDNASEFPEIRRMENIAFTPTWLHIDTVEHAGRGIRVFTP